MTDPRRPGAFRLDELDDADIRETPLPEPPPPPAAGDLPDNDAPPEGDAFDEAASRPPRWKLTAGTLFWAGLGGLVTFGTGLAIDRLIEDLFARSDTLGLMASVLAVVFFLGVIGIIARESFALARLSKIGKLHARAVAIAASDDQTAARVLAADLDRFYRHRPESARGRAALAGYARDIIDGRDLLVLAERELLTDLDLQARRLVVGSARRVSVVTALSPRALVDLAYVAAESISLVRRLARLYGGRPGFLGFLKLAKAVVAHLAVTGGMAAGDSFVNEMLGHGIAARLSARLGEGVINGLMTARVGLAAIDVCRPLPFLEAKRPTVAEITAAIAKVTPGQR